MSEEKNSTVLQNSLELSLLREKKRLLAMKKTTKHHKIILGSCQSNSARAWNPRSQIFFKSLPKVYFYERSIFFEISAA